MKACTKCLIVKPYSEFNVDNASKDKHQYYCRECMIQAIKNTRKKNRVMKIKKLEDANKIRMRLLVLTAAKSMMKKVPDFKSFENFSGQDMVTVFLALPETSRERLYKTFNREIDSLIDEQEELFDKI